MDAWSLGRQVLAKIFRQERFNANRQIWNEHGGDRTSDSLGSTEAHSGESSLKEDRCGGPRGRPVSAPTATALNQPDSRRSMVASSYRRVTAQGRRGPEACHKCMRAEYAKYYAAVKRKFRREGENKMGASTGQSKPGATAAKVAGEETDKVDASTSTWSDHRTGDYGTCQTTEHQTTVAKGGTKKFRFVIDLCSLFGHLEIGNIFSAEKVEPQVLSCESHLAKGDSERLEEDTASAKKLFVHGTCGASSRHRRCAPASPECPRGDACVARRGPAGLGARRIVAAGRDAALRACQGYSGLGIAAARRAPPRSHVAQERRGTQSGKPEKDEPANRAASKDRGDDLPATGKHQHSEAARCCNRRASNRTDPTNVGRRPRRACGKKVAEDPPGATEDVQGRRVRTTLGVKAGRLQARTPRADEDADGRSSTWAAENRTPHGNQAARQTRT